MTNLVTATGSATNEFVITFDGLDIPGFLTILSWILTILSWISILVIVISAIVISCKWIIKRTEDRNPTSFAVAILIQMLCFLLVNTVDGVMDMCANVALMLPDREMWYLCLTFVIGPLLWNILACVFSLTLVSLVARKLPVLPASMIFPLVVVLLDVAVLLIWTTHILI
jgi:hypothetical protein